MKLTVFILSAVFGTPVEPATNSTDVTGEKTIGSWFGNNYIFELMMRNEEKDSRAAGVAEKLGEHPSTLCIHNDEIDYGLLVFLAKVIKLSLRLQRHARITREVCGGQYVIKAVRMIVISVLDLSVDTPPNDHVTIIFAIRPFQEKRFIIQILSGDYILSVA